MSNNDPIPFGCAVIPMLNKLQEVLAQVGDSTVELPVVAVVGSQSSGKSSVLEALVGRDFLPRGSDICTRRPLLLQLVKIDDKDGDEYGEFKHLPGKKFANFDEIRGEIEIETEREAGGNKGVSNKQIGLTIYSPNVLDITLVDLPGMTKVPVGDQPSDIEIRIRTMILSYIRQPSCLILAVTPANSDLVNSDALQIARIADPDGNRTIGVITKLDIMDRGTDACNLLLGKVIPLRLGYFGVVNRSQQDIMLNRSIKDALASEETFFRSHPVYTGLTSRCGIPQLAKKLNQILVQHIQKVLPGLKSQIRTKMLSVDKELSGYGEITESKSGHGTLLLNIISKYSEAFASMVEGRNEEMLTAELYGGARIHYIFQSIFVDRLEDVDPCENLTDEDIRTAIQNATGPRSALFVPEVPFQVLIRRQIARLLDPSLECARFIYNELVKMSNCCMVSELQRFPFLRKRMDEIVGNFLQEGLEPAETMIGHIVEMELDYINTSHPNFLTGSKAVEVALRQIRSSRLSSATPTQRDGVDTDATPASERGPRSRAIVVRSQANGFISDQGIQPVTEIQRNGLSGVTSGSNWGIPSIFSGRENRTQARDIARSNSHTEPAHRAEHALSMIHLREPPTVLRSSEMHSEQEAIAIAVTKLLLGSYYVIVRKNIEDIVPKAIMHFLVNRSKRELHNVLIRKLYRDHFLEELLQETEEVVVKRTRARETLQALQQAYQILDALSLEAETI
ncbi:hypothetical protein LguiA_005391 [Lonicera macranthoides]